MDQTTRNAAETRAEEGDLPRFAIVIPMKDEAGALGDLLDGCLAAASPLGPFEFCITDDGSSDGTGQGLSDWAAGHGDVPFTVVRHDRSAGQSAGVHNAVRAARAPVIVTLDGDGQNPPSEIPKLLEALIKDDADPRLGLVAGQRAVRNDTLAKRWASRAANKLRAAVLNDGTRDTGCGLKAFRRDAFLALPYFNHMHRYLPSLFMRDGWGVAHVDVAHEHRTSGASKYTNFGRAIVGASDLIGVAWLIRRRKRLPPGDVTVSKIGTKP